jgi:ABC-2 type transport system permease protein
MAVRDHLRTMKYAAWLGWKMDSNWTNPVWFIAYSIIKPIAATLILVFMYLVIWSSALANPAVFSYMFIGNAFYMYVAQVLFGLVMVIHDDREHYQTLKQVYIAPISLYFYIIGRAIPKIITTTFGVLITLAFGVVILSLPIDLGTLAWGLLAVAMVIGLACICMIGIALAGVSMLTAKHGYGINEGIAGAFYLFCGVVFPITVLPGWGQAIGMVIPITYWLELVRRAVLSGSGVQNISGLEGFSNLEILIFLVLSTLLFFVLSLAIFRYADYLARKKGKLDMTTAY